MDKKIVKNYIYNVLYQILLLAVPLITTPYVSRVLGVENIGAYSFTSANVSYFAMIAAFSFQTYGQREIAYNQKDKKKISLYFWNIELQKLVIGIIVTLVYLVFTFNRRRYYQLYLIQLLTIVATFFDINFFFQGLELFKITVIRNTVVKIIGIILIFTCVKSRNDLWIYVLIQCTTVLLGNITLWFYLPRYICKVSYKDLRLSKDLKELVELFIPVISVQLYYTIDKTMLGSMLPTTVESGYYEQAIKIIRMCQNVMTSMGVVLISSVSRIIAENDIKKVKETVGSAIEFNIFLAAPMTLGLISIANILVPWFLGTEFTKSGTLIMILAPMALLTGMSNIAGNGVLIPTNRQNYLTIATLGGALVNIILNYLSIPKYYSMGAAVASVCSEIVVLILQYIFAKQYLDFKKIFKALFKYLLLSIVMAITIFLFCYVFSTYLSSLTLTIISILIGILVYVMLLVSIKDKIFMKIVNKVRQISMLK